MSTRQARPGGVDSRVIVLPTSRVRALRGKSGQRQLWTDVLADPRRLTALTVIKRTDRVGVWSAAVDGRQVILKAWPIAGLAARSYAALGLTRASRQWRGSERLAGVGVQVPEMLALVRGRSSAGDVEALVMTRVDGRTLLDHLAHPTVGPRVEHRIAEALARQCAAMARAGVFNRDHKPSNLIVTGATECNARLVVLDSVAIRPLPGGPRSAPLERLVLEAIGVGAPPRRALVARFIAQWTQLTAPGLDQRRLRRETWRVLGARIANHGDPTPTDNPLSAGVAT